MTKKEQTEKRINEVAKIFAGEYVEENTLNSKELLRAEAELLEMPVLRITEKKLLAWMQLVNSEVPRYECQYFFDEMLFLAMKTYAKGNFLQYLTQIITVRFLEKVGV